MPKKSAAARSGAQRNKPRVQKSIELVRQPVEEKEILAEKVVETEAEAEGSDDMATTSASTVANLNAQSASAKKERIKDVVATSPKKNAAPPLTAPDSQAVEISSSAIAAPKGSAAARLAARRQAAQKTQQRAAPSLITAEHYAYVRRELVIIAILAIIMFSVIITLHFVPGIGG